MQEVIKIKDLRINLNKICAYYPTSESVQIHGVWHHYKIMFHCQEPDASYFSRFETKEEYDAILEWLDYKKGITRIETKPVSKTVDVTVNGDIWKPKLPVFSPEPHSGLK